MTTPRHTHRLRPLPPGDHGRITPVTRIIWADERDMPACPDGTVKNAMAAIEEDGSTVILIREGLSAAVRRAEVRRLRAELHKLGAGRIAAWAIVAGDGLRRFGWGYLRMRATAGAQDTMTLLAEHVGTAAIGTVAIAGAGSIAFALTGGGGPTGPVVGSPAWHRQHPVHVTLPARPLSYLGAYETTSPASYSGMETFAKTSGREANLALYYSGWFEHFQSAFAEAASDHGAIPLVQIDPVTGAGPGAPGQPVSLAAIASGAYDSYLTSYADAVASYRQAVVIGFGHEMNGDWYSWGYRNQKASDFVAAWQHIVDVFHRQGADNVTWLWTVNKVAAKTGPLSSFWPGSAYVTWVGIDGYYQHTDDTWDSVFGPTITQIRRFTHAPLLIAETAIGPVGTEPWQLDDIFASIRQGGLLGLVWFDKNQSSYLSYRLEGDPKDSAVFRQLTLPWRLIHQRGAKPEAAGAQPVQPVAGGSSGGSGGLSAAIARSNAARAATGETPGGSRISPVRQGMSSQSPEMASAAPSSGGISKPKKRASASSLRSSPRTRLRRSASSPSSPMWPG